MLTAWAKRQRLADKRVRKIPKGTPESATHHPQGSIYRFDDDGTLVIAQQGGVGAGNGLCWSPDGGTMYHVDSYFNVSENVASINGRTGNAFVDSCAAHLCLQLRPGVWYHLKEKNSGNAGQV